MDNRRFLEAMLGRRLIGVRVRAARASALAGVVVAGCLGCTRAVGTRGDASDGGLDEGDADVSTDAPRDVRADAEVGTDAEADAQRPVCEPGVDCPETAMATVPEGAFLMGCDLNRGDCFVNGPIHEVYVAAYEIAVTETTQADYLACVEAGGCAWLDGDVERRHLPYCEGTEFQPFERPDYPVVCATWHHARDYCRWARMRLCTEAEWERGARGEDGRIYPWGDDRPDSASSWLFGWDPVGPVARHALDISPHGLFDMADNAIEWVNDCYLALYYLESPYEDPPGPAEPCLYEQRVIRSLACWHDPEATSRFGARASSSSGEQGFRCCRTPE